MHWSAAPGAGFTTGRSTWLPLGDAAAWNVEAERRDEDSILHLCRRAIAYRRSSDDLRSGAYHDLPAPPGVWLFRRGAATTVALNLGARETTIEGMRGVIRVACQRAREGERVDGGLRLAPFEAAVVAP
jgi:alpha-glucosidase